jgi:ferritin
MTKAMQDAINEQIKHELYSSYLYLAMAAYCDSAGFPGFAHWMRAQSGEERGHAMKMYGHLVDRGARVVLKAIDAPPANYASPIDAMEKVQEHERKVTALIQKLYEVALKEKDYAAQNFLQWFVSEQVEEEKNVAQILDQIKVGGKQGPALLMLDHALGARKAD